MKVVELLNMKPIVAGLTAAAGAVSVDPYLPEPAKVIAVLSWVACAAVGAFVSHSHAKIVAATRKDHDVPIPAFRWVFVRAVGVGILFGLGLSAYIPMQLDDGGPNPWRAIIAPTVVFAGMIAEWVMEAVIKIGKDFAHRPWAFIARAFHRYKLGSQLEDTGRFKADDLSDPSNKKVNGPAPPTRHDN